MKYPRIYIAIFIALNIVSGSILLAQGNIVNVSGSPTKIASEFLSAAMNGDFKKIAILCCKNNGPFTSHDDVKRLDLSDIGHIEKILREESSEGEPTGLKLVVIRAKVLGEIGFYCFNVFNTSGGYKIYLSGDLLKKYPQDKNAQVDMALNFYYSNNINLNKSIELAESLKTNYPNNIDNHYKLAMLYKRNKQRDKAIDEISQIALINVASPYLNNSDETDLISVAEKFLKNPATKTTAFTIIKKLPDGKKIPILESIIKNNDLALAEDAARYLTSLGNDTGKEYLIKYLSEKLRINGKELVSKPYNQTRSNDTIFSAVMFELGELRDVRALPILIESYAERYYAPVNILWAIEKIGSPALPSLESIDVNEIKSKWKARGCQDYELSWIDSEKHDASILRLIKKIKKDAGISDDGLRNSKNNLPGTNRDLNIAPKRLSEPARTYTEAELITALKNADYIITGGKNYTIRWTVTPNPKDRRYILEKINDGKKALSSAAEIARGLSNSEALDAISMCEGALDRDQNNFNSGGGGKNGLRDAQRALRAYLKGK